MRPPSTNSLKGPYSRNRDNPRFNGLLRDDDASSDLSFPYNLQGSSGYQKSSMLNTSETSMEPQFEDSFSGIVIEPFRQPSFRSLSNTEKESSFPLTSPEADLNLQSSFERLSKTEKESSFALRSPEADINLLSSFERLSKTEKESSFALRSPEADLNLQSSFERLSKTKKESSFALRSPEADLNYDSGDTYDPIKPSCDVSEVTKGYHENVSAGLPRPVPQKSYIVNRTKLDLLKISLPQSAASFYNGALPQLEIVESCESIKRLNSYLKARRDDVNSGVPGRFLHAVIGQDVCDIGSIVSTIMYAFYLNETIENDQLCTVPVINMKRTELSSHAEAAWLLDSCQIDESLLIFVDEIDLSYYNLFGSLMLVLLNGHKLPTKQETLKEAVVEIFNCREGESAYPWVETVTGSQDSDSCCALVAEKFSLTLPEILSGRGFSRLLLAGILMDTGNLASPHCTAKDNYMATLLINGSGRFGCNGLYQILKYKMYDISDLKVVDILRKDLKKWRRAGKPDSDSSRSTATYIGMSTIGISIGQLIAHGETSAKEIKYFQRLEKIGLLTIVSGYYDSMKNFKREVLVAADSAELVKNLLSFFSSDDSVLPLNVLHLPGLRNEMRAFEVDKVTSRRKIERLLEEFAGIAALKR